MRSTVVLLAAAVVVGFFLLGGATASPEAATNLPPALQFGDQSGCPCLAPEVLQNRTGMVRMDGQDCLDLNQSSCYPPFYGAATCRAWDRGESFDGLPLQSPPLQQVPRDIAPGVITVAIQGTLHLCL